MLLLTILSIAVAAVLVLLLAGYLVAIGWKLMQARHNIVRLANTLETIAQRSEPLGDKVARVDAAMAGLEEEMRAASEAVIAAIDGVESRRRSATGA